jgi:hypothetical protein
MPLEQEIDRIYARLERGLIEPEIAGCAVEQLVSAHLRVPAADIDAGVRCAIDRLRNSPRPDPESRIELGRRLRALSPACPRDAVLWL